MNYEDQIKNNLCTDDSGTKLKKNNYHDKFGISADQMNGKPLKGIYQEENLLSIIPIRERMYPMIGEVDNLKE